MGDRVKVRTTAARTTRATRPRLEALDDRIVPANIFWTGEVSGLWNNAGNWVDTGGTHVAPQPGDDLTFQAVAPGNITAGNLTNTNNLPANTAFSSVTIAAPGYTLSGNAVTLTGGGSASGITGAFPTASTTAGAVSTVDLPVTFTTAPQAIATTTQATSLVFSPLAQITLTSGIPLTFNTIAATQGTGGTGPFGNLTSSVTVGGNITGTGNVIKTGTGLVVFAPAQRNIYSGTTTVINGTLGLAAAGGGSTSVSVPGDLTIGDDSTFDGLASVILGAGEQIQDTANVTVLSDGTLAVGTFFETIQNLNLGTAAGAGTVTGAGTLALGQDINVTGSGLTNQISPVVSLATGAHTFNVTGVSNPNQVGSDLLLTSGINGLASTTLTISGGGRVELRGASTGTIFPVTVAAGRVDLNNQSGSATSVLPGDVTIGDGSGTAATVRILAQNAIADTGVVTMNANGTLDQSNFGAFSEVIGGLSSTAGTARVVLGTNTLVIQPTVNYKYAGSVTGTGQVKVQSTGGIATGSQEFSGPVTLTGNFFGTDGLTADANGIIVVDSTNVSGGLSTLLSTNGIISGTGTVDTLDATFSGAGNIVRPGTYQTPGTQATAANFTPGTLSAGTFGLGDATFEVQINDAVNYGQIRVTQAFTNNAFVLPTLKVTLPTGFIPGGGQAFTILDVVPTGLFLNNTGSSSLSLFQDTNGNLLTEGSTFTAFNSNQRFVISYRGGDGNDVVIYNTQAPTAVISGGTVSGNTATFTATFSGPVGPISPTGIVVNTTGTVADTFVSSTRLSDTVYLITVNGLTGTGTVSVMLAQGAAFSGSGTPIQPSNTSTVDVTNLPPVPPSPPTPGDNNGRSGGRLLVAAGPGGSGAVNVYQGQPVITQALNLPLPQFVAGARVATADFNRDGVRDYVFATGPGTSAFFQVLDGKTGALLFSAAPFESTFTGGLNVATGDINADGVPDLVVTPDEGGGPRVLVFSGAGFTLLADFFGIADPNFRGGARAAVGDLNGDGYGDLVVAAGFGGGPRVAVYNGASIGVGPPTKLLNDFFVFEPALRNGAYVAVVDVNGDGKGDLIAGGGPGGAPRVSVFDGASLSTGSVSLVSTFFAGDENARGGIRLAAADYDGNGVLSLVTGAGEGDGSQVRVYSPPNLVTSNPIPEAVFDAFPGFSGGVFVG